MYKNLKSEYNSNSYRSGKSQNSIENNSDKAVNPVEGKKTPILSKCVQLIDKECSNRYIKKKVKRKQKKVKDNCIDLFKGQVKCYQNTVLKFNISDNKCEQIKSSDEEEQVEKEEYRAPSKQKIVLKIPTMISVEIEVGSDKSDSVDNCKIKEKKRKDKNRRYKNLQTIEKFKSKGLRKEYKIKENSLSEKIME